MSPGTMGLDWGTIEAETMAIRWTRTDRHITLAIPAGIVPGKDRNVILTPKQAVKLLRVLSRFLRKSQRRPREL